MIPKSGGDYAYLGEAFGSLPSFLYLWVALFILVPTGNAITALTFAQNILKPLWPACTPPDVAVSLIAAFITCKYSVIPPIAFWGEASSYSGRITADYGLCYWPRTQAKVAPRAIKRTMLGISLRDRIRDKETRRRTTTFRDSATFS